MKEYLMKLDQRVGDLDQRYKEIAQISGLKEDIKRARVSNYKRIKID